MAQSQSTVIPFRRGLWGYSGQIVAWKIVLMVTTYEEQKLFQDYSVSKPVDSLRKKKTIKPFMVYLDIMFEWTKSLGWSIFRNGLNKFSYHKVASSGTSHMWVYVCMFELSRSASISAKSTCCLIKSCQCVGHNFNFFYFLMHSGIFWKGQQTFWRV